MKNLRTILVCIGLVGWSLAGNAQMTTPPVTEPDYNKPRLFNSLSNRIELETADLNGLFGKQPGQTTSLKMSADNSIRLEGETVSSGTDTKSRVEQVVIRAQNFNGARLFLSKIQHEDGTITYRGRIISKAHGDLYELEYADGRYSLVKKGYYDLINE